MARNKFDVDEVLETPFSFQHLKRAFVYIKKYSRQMAGALVLSAAASIISLFGPLLMQEAIDKAIPDKSMSYLFLLSGMLIGTILINILFNWIKAVIMTKVGQGIIFDIRHDLFEHLQKLPFSYYDNRPHGKILVRVVQYVNNVSDMLSNGIINSIIEIFNIVFIAVFMFRVNVKLALIVIAGLPVFVFFIILIKGAQRKAWQKQSNKNSNYNAFLHESIEGVHVTQAFAREEENRSISHRLLEACRSAWMRAAMISQTVWVAGETITQIVFTFVYICGVFWITPIITIGTVVAMSNYVSRFWQPIINLANIYNSFINTIAYLERIFETMDEPVEICDVEGASALPAIDGSITFDDVTFSYDESAVILKNVNFHVNPGESVALVGPTGAGKTTVVNLISRFYNLDSGAILIDGHDIAQVTLQSLREQMGIMLQDSFIFSGTIYDNIRYGRLDATNEEIVAAAKVVCADTFIRQMEDGYNTMVNERGSRLSQGEKQLIAFARTLLADPKILILDEATSSIDTQTEKLLQIGLNELLKGRTSFIIAHRLSTIKNCDKIMYIADKNIAECGTHDELMEKKGAYYKLYTSQALAQPEIP